MAALEITSALLQIGPKAEIRADIRDWMTEGGPTWEPSPMHGSWLHIEELCFAFPQDPAARERILERLADAVERLVTDARAQLVEAAQTASDQTPTVMADWPSVLSDMAPGELVEIHGK